MKLNYLACPPLTLLLLNVWLPIAALAAERDSRCFELRTYYAAPGKLDALHARFRDHTCKIFEKHGMANVGYWVPVENKENKLVYILAYPSREAREKSWKGFFADPDWQAAYKASEVNGKLVDKVESVLLTATAYSPPIKPSKSEQPRLFELRTYKAAPGKLDPLNARFRDHTLALFNKHGMTHVGYWTPTDKKDGAEDTLIYILAHPSAQARDKAFAAFRADPAWVSAKSASEKEGSLTTKVDSMLLTPTDYSPMR